MPCAQTEHYTVDSRYLEFRRDSLKYFEISVPRHIRFTELRKKITQTTTFNKYMCNWALEVRDILKILRKRGEIAPKSNFSSFPQYFFTCC